MTHRQYLLLLSRPRGLSMLALAITLGGAGAALHLPLDLLPVREYPRCTVVTRWPGRSPEDVEQRVTSSIEAMAHTVRGVRAVTSVSEVGVSLVEIELDGRREPAAIRSELRDRLRDPGLQLPADVGGPAVEGYLPVEMRDVRGFMIYVVHGEGSLAEIGKLAEEKVAPALRSVSGVSAVDVLGLPRLERRVEIDREKLRSIDVQRTGIVEALQVSGMDTSLPTSLRNGALWVVSAGTPYTGPARASSVSIAQMPHGSSLLLSAVAMVTDTAVAPEIEVRIGGRHAVTVHIDRHVGTNALEVARDVRRRVSELRLPAHASLYLQVDRTRPIQREMDRLVSHALWAFAAVAVVLLLMLRSPAHTVIVLAVPVTSLGATMIILAQAGVGLHLFSMAGLVLGMGRLVDDAIVVVQHLRWHVRGALVPESVACSMPPIALPVGASTAVALGALGGAFVAPEPVRPFLIEFSIAAGSSLAVSCISSLVLVPAMLCAGGLHSGMSRGMTAPLAWYERALTACLHHPRSVLLGALLLMGIPVWMVPDRIPGESAPARVLNQALQSRAVRRVRSIVEPVLGGTLYYFAHAARFRDLLGREPDSRLVFWAAFPHGTPRKTYRSVAETVERGVLNLVGREHTVIVQVGHDYCALLVEFDGDARTLSLPFAVRDFLVAQAASYGVGYVAVNGFGPGFSAGFEGGAALAVRVAGYRYDNVRSIAESLCARLRSVPRVASIDMDRSFTLREEMFEIAGIPDRERLVPCGLDMAGLARGLLAETGGTVVREDRVGHHARPPLRVVDGVGETVRLAELAATRVPGTNGCAERISDLMTFRVQRTPARILREGQQYVRWITFEYRGAERAGAQVVDTLLAALPIPPGYSVRRQRPAGGDVLSEGNFEGILLVGGMSLLMAWVIAAVAYDSLVLPCLTLLTVPFSFVGIFVIYPLAGIPFGRGGVMAALLLVGIVASNAVVLLDRLRPPRTGNCLAHEEIVARAKERLQPILLTAAATLAGVMPLALAGREASMEFSLAVGLAAGLVSGTIFTLLVLPVLVTVVTGARRHP